MANEKNLIGAPVHVETSDERLAAVEEAKRTGDELVSVGSKGGQIVDRGTLVEETRKVSNEGASETSSLPLYLEELVDNLEDEAELNIRKAKAHSDYSAELARKQQEAAVEAEAKLREDPLYFVKQITERNQKLAQQYNEKMGQYIKEVEGRNSNFNEEIRRITQEEAFSGEPVTEMGKRAQDFKIDENFAKDALQTKDRIIYGAEDYLGGVADEQPVPQVDESRKQEQPEETPEKHQNDQASQEVQPTQEAQTSTKSARKENKSKE